MEQRERQIRFAVTADGRILETEFCDEEVAGYVDFAVLEDNTVKLLRWPRNTAAVRLPETVGGCLITGIAPLAFAGVSFSRRDMETVWRGFLSFVQCFLYHACHGYAAGSGGCGWTYGNLAS